VAKRQAKPDIQALIAEEFYIGFERLGTGAELLAIVGRRRDMLSDDEVLILMCLYNTTGKALCPSANGRSSSSFPRRARNKSGTRSRF
jgi:hypothetical protein